MLEVFKYGLGFQIKSKSLKKVNIVAELLDIKKEEYGEPFIIATLSYNESIVYNFAIDGKYRLSIKTILNVDSLVGLDVVSAVLEYKYIESYNVFLKQTIKAVKNFICESTECGCEDSGETLEKGNQAVSMLLGYYNLATNSDFNSYQLCSGNVIDLFVRKMFDTNRLEFLNDLHTLSKKDCISNVKLSIPSLKKIVSVYYLALYNYEIYNQISLKNGENLIDEINTVYDIYELKRCTTRQGFDFDTSVKIFNEVKPETRLVKGVDKHFELEANVLEEKYSFEIVPSDLYHLPTHQVLRNTIYLNLITLPFIGKLKYVDRFGEVTTITAPDKYKFDLLTTEKLIYEYESLSDTNSDVFLYNLSNILDDCKNDTDYNKVSIKINEYEYDASLIPLNVIAVKVNDTILTPFNFYHIYKILKRKIDIYNVESIAINTDTSYVKIMSDAGDLLNGLQPITHFAGDVFIEKGNDLEFDEPYRGSIEFKFLDGKRYEVAIFFRLDKDENFDGTFPFFTVNSSEEEVIEFKYPFYDKEYLLYADSVNEHIEPLIFYFQEVLNNDSDIKDLEVISNNGAIVKNSFPKERIITITSNTNKNSYTKTIRVNNTKADIRIYWDSNETNQIISFGEEELGLGKILNVAWDTNVINKNKSYTYPTLKNKETFLEIYPHDRFKYNNPRLKDIEMLGTFKRINLSLTSIGNKSLELIEDLANRTPSDNIDNLPIGLASFPTYFIAKSVRFNEPRQYIKPSLFKNMYAKGILVNLAKTEFKHPTPISEVESDKDFPDFVVNIKQEEVPNFLPKVTASIEILDKSKTYDNLAKVPIYARFEGFDGDKWIHLKVNNFYENFAMYESRLEDKKFSEIININNLQANRDGFYQIRVAYQGPSGPKVTEALLVKPLESSTDSHVRRLQVTESGVYVFFTNKVEVGKNYKYSIPAEDSGDIYVTSKDFIRPDINTNYVFIPVDSIPYELLNKANLFIEIYNDSNEFLERVEFPNSKYRLSLLPNSEAGLPLAKEYIIDVYSPEELDEAVLLYHNFNLHKFRPLYGGVIFYNVSVLYSINEMLYEVLIKDENDKPYVNLPLSKIPVVNKGRFFIKSKVEIMERVGGKVQTIDTIESYSIIINLAYLS